MWPENASWPPKPGRERHLGLGVFGALFTDDDGGVADAGGATVVVGVGAVVPWSGGQESSWIFPVARSTSTRRVARGLAGSETMTRASAFAAMLGLSCKGRRVAPGVSSAAISGKSKRTRSI